MKFTYIYILLLLIFKLSSCQEITSYGHDYVMPYQLSVPDSNFIKLPDSLGGDKYYGNALLQVKMNNNGKIISIELWGLLLKRKVDNYLVLDFEFDELQVFQEFSSFQTFCKNYLLKFPIVPQEQPQGQADEKEAVGSEFIKVFFR